ncbi:MAG TPA: sigma-54 dependent transcriptional regulator [Gemmatimonadaceae bacterium]|nr:sigma-54 dependent transcriptional regulator [Gemmatimonadaceae bacterium]
MIGLADARTAARMPPPSVEPARTSLRVLAVASDDERDAFDIIREWAAAEGDMVETAPDLPRATRRLAAERWDAVAVIVDDRAPDELDWWADAVRGVEGVPRLIAFTRRPSMRLILQAERLGVVDVLPLPARREDVERLLQRLRATLADRGVALPAVDVHAVGQTVLVGQSPAMLDVYKMIARVAPSAATVLLLGDSGTGKEVVARAIHAAGPRASGPFVTVNCAAIPENLLESELFGHEKGAFTGAVARRAGRFELAVGGTLFLDEIGDMSLALQAKMLRAVQERVVERVGGGEPIPVDVRLIAATNCDLRDAMQEGKFREDLYYRLSVLVVNLPRLIDRGDDLLLLTSYYIREFSTRYGRPPLAISEHALELLRDHPWVGNVRELRNVIERAVIIASEGVLRAEHLPDDFRAHTPLPPVAADSGMGTIAEVEARHISRVLANTGGAIGTAASVLGIHRNTLARKMREYGL